MHDSAEPGHLERHHLERTDLERAARDLRGLLRVIRTRLDNIRDPRAPPASRSDGASRSDDDLDDIDEAVARAMDVLGELSPAGSTDEEL